MSLFFLTFCRVEMRWEAQHLPWMHDGDSSVNTLGLIPLPAILIPARFASLKPRRFQDCKAEAAAEHSVYCKSLVHVRGSPVHANVVREQLCKATWLGSGICCQVKSPAAKHKTSSKVAEFVMEMPALAQRRENLLLHGKSVDYVQYLQFYRKSSTDRVTWWCSLSHLCHMVCESKSQKLELFFWSYNKGICASILILHLL